MSVAISHSSRESDDTPLTIATAITRHQEAVLERLDEEDEELDGASSFAIDVITVARSALVLGAVLLGVVCGGAIAIQVNMAVGIGTMIMLSTVLVVGGLTLMRLVELAVWRRLAARVCTAPPV